MSDRTGRWNAMLGLVFKRAPKLIPVFIGLLFAVAACSDADVAPANAPGENRPVRILALGDSYTIGERVGKLENWPAQLVRRLRVAGRAAAEPEVVASTGWDTGDLTRAVTTASPQGPFDLVTLLIGVNNQFRDGTVEEFEAELAWLAETAIGFAGGDADRVIMISIPDWGVTPFAEGAPRAEIAEAIDRFNDVIRNRARETGTRFIDITGISRRAASEPELIASDGLHPSAQMYAEWVEIIFPVVIELVETTD